MKKVIRFIAILVLGLALLGISCSGGTTAPAKEQPAPPPVEKQEAPKTEEPAASGGPPAIPHPLEGRDNCLMCHAEGGLKPVPADHDGRTVDMCQACHKPAG